jgi:hypothetical protein
MNRKFLVLIGVAAAFTAGSLIAAERDASLYVGVKSCKMCHKKPEEGEQFVKWSDSKHAKAFETLGTSEAKEAGKKAGVDDPQKSGKCLKCHSTAYNFTETVATQDVPVEEGVSCESCHGPGKNYKKKEIMKVKADAIAQGLVEKPKEFCTKCHNDQSPSWKPDRYTLKDGTKAGFDVEQTFEKIKHPLPPKTP